MDINQIKRIIQNMAWKDFPARELWLRDGDLNFWAFDYENCGVSITHGKYVDKDIIMYQTTNHPNNGNIDETIKQMTDDKFEEGYRCFAIQLFN